MIHVVRAEEQLNKLDVHSLSILDDTLSKRKIQNIINDMEYIDGRQSRIDQAQTLSKKISLNNSNNEKKDYIKVSFEFIGPTLDIDLTRFYSFFVNNYPEALEPVIVNFDVVSDSCSVNNTYKCKTLSHAAFHYGLLAKYYPESSVVSFTNDVINPLKKKFNKDVIPGITTNIFEKTVRVHNVEVDTICPQYSIDKKYDCYEEKIGPYTYLVGQGIEVELGLPKEKYVELLDGYFSSIKDSEGYKLNNINFYLEDYTVVFDSVHNKKNSTTKSSTLSLKQIAKSNFIDVEYNSTKCTQLYNEVKKIHLNDLTNHIKNYIKYFYTYTASGEEKLGNVDYPHIRFIDRIPKSRSLLSSDNTTSQLTPFHTDWLKKEDIKKSSIHKTLDLKNECIDISPPPDGHGIFTSGLLLAKRNNKGIVGLLPELERKKSIKIYNVIDNNNSTKLPGAFRVISNEAKKNTNGFFIVNISSRFKKKRNPLYEILRKNPREDIKKQAEATEARALYVVSAGQLEEENIGEWLEKDCEYIPACFGDLINIITVTYFDNTNNKNLPIITQGNIGHNVVSIAAPGVDIISTDIKQKGDAISEYTYSARTGSSASTPFVTAVAAEITRRAKVLMKDRTIFPWHIKQRILSTVDPVYGPDKSLYFFSKSKTSPVQSGTLNGTKAIENIDKTVVVLNDKQVIGDIKTNLNNDEFVIYENEFEYKGRFACKVKDLLRIHKVLGTNQYTVVCKYEERNIKFATGYIHHGKDEMECVKKGDCFLITNAEIIQKQWKLGKLEKNTSQSDLSNFNINKIHDIYFSM
ncbi:MAG: S8 family serine peptidase [Candidatus Thiodiazotropha endolucinida]